MLHCPSTAHPELLVSIAYPQSQALMKTIDLVSDVLRDHHKDRAEGLHPKLDLMRRCSREHWRSLYAELKSRNLQDHPMWKRAMPYLDTIGRLLGVNKYSDSGPLPTGLFTALERCRSKDCLCSIHKPIHHLRICTGCWCAAYCNVRCQTK